MPIMGNVQEMFYDQPRVPAEIRQPATEWLRLQLREFVLHYFMRVSSFRQPDAFVDCEHPAPEGLLGRLSWCTREETRRTGFGFSQLYYKLRDTGEVGKFVGDEQSAIVDLRQIGTKYEWIVAKVRIFDFSFKFKTLFECFRGTNQFQHSITSPVCPFPHSNSFWTKSRRQLLLIQGRKLPKRVNSPLVEDIQNLADLGLPIFCCRGIRRIRAPHALKLNPLLNMFK